METPDAHALASPFALHTETNAIAIHSHSFAYIRSDCGTCLRWHFPDAFQRPTAHHRSNTLTSFGRSFACRESGIFVFVAANKKKTRGQILILTKYFANTEKSVHFMFADASEKKGSEQQKLNANIWSPL